MTTLVALELKAESMPSSIVRLRRTNSMAGKCIGGICVFMNCNRNPAEMRSPQKRPKFLRKPDLRLILFLPAQPQSI
jgi:hypothetical protein